MSKHLIGDSRLPFLLPNRSLTIQNSTKSRYLPVFCSAIWQIAPRSERRLTSLLSTRAARFAKSRYCLFPRRME